MSTLPPQLTLPITPKIPTKPNKSRQQQQQQLSLQQNNLLSLLQLCKHTTEFTQLHAHFTKLGLIHNPLALTRLLCYASISPHSDINYARSIFDLDKNPNTFSYNVMIRGYARSEFPEKALPLLCSMLSGGVNSVPNQLTFPFVFKACGALRAVEEGKQVHGLVCKLGLCGDLFVQNSLIGFYGSCALVGFACQVFDKMAERDLVSLNSVISSLVGSGFMEEGRSLFDRMTNRSLVTWNCLVDGYVKAGMMSEARELFGQMEVKDTITWNTMIGGYVGSRLMEDARRLFDEMPQGLRDVITFDLLIDGYAREDRYKEVMEIFQEMPEAKIEPTKFTLVSLLTACSLLVDFEHGEWAADYIESHRIEVDAVLGTALINFFSKCGCIERALSVFENMKERDVGTWNSMIHNLGVHGYGQEAIKTFSDMSRSKTHPDELTFLCLLSACRHSGLVNDGKRFFQLMSEKHGLLPKVEHYGCMVDLLCRADLVEEARDLIESSGVSSVPMWGSFLGASSRLGNLALGEYAAQHLMELDPFDGSCYIILSNMYSAAGFYEKALQVRNKMRELGLDKVPGSSSIEVDGSVQDFRVSSVFFDQVDFIY